MKKKNLNDRLVKILLDKSPEEARRAIISFAAISKFKISNSDLKEYYKKNKGISAGLAQSVLYARGENITKFKGDYAGAFISVTDPNKYSFEGPSAGEGSSFKGNYVGKNSSFKGMYAGWKSSFEGDWAGMKSSFKRYSAGMGSSFKGYSAGMKSSFEGDRAGEGSSFKGVGVGVWSSFERKKD